MQPSEFDEMHPNDADALSSALDDLLKDEFMLWLKLAQVAGGGKLT